MRPLSNSGSKEQARRKRILKRDMGICHVCDQPGADQVDHASPSVKAELMRTGTWRQSMLSPATARKKTAAEARRARA